MKRASLTTGSAALAFGLAVVMCSCGARTDLDPSPSTRVEEPDAGTGACAAPPAGCEWVAGEPIRVSPWGDMVEGLNGWIAASSCARHELMLVGRTPERGPPRGWYVFLLRDDPWRVVESHPVVAVQDIGRGTVAAAFPTPDGWLEVWDSYVGSAPECDLAWRDSEYNVLHVDALDGIGCRPQQVSADEVALLTSVPRVSGTTEVRFVSLITGVIGEPIHVPDSTLLVRRHGSDGFFGITEQEAGVGAVIFREDGSVVARDSMLNDLSIYQFGVDPVADRFVLSIRDIPLLRPSRLVRIGAEGERFTVEPLATLDWYVDQEGPLVVVPQQVLVPNFASGLTWTTESAPGVLHEMPGVGAPSLLAAVVLAFGTGFGGISWIHDGARDDDYSTWFRPLTCVP